MGRVNTATLTPEQGIEFESGVKISHCLRMRCHAILLKTEGRSLNGGRINYWHVQHKCE